MVSTSDMPSLAESAVDITPFGSNSEDVLERRDHALFGVSTGNSYFSRRRLAKALSWAAANFSAVDVVYADMHLESMCEALGYGRVEARRSAGKQIRGVKRRIKGALEDIGRAAVKVRVRPLSAFSGEPAYSEVRERTREALRLDAELCAARDGMARNFLGKRLGPGSSPSAAQMQASLDYVDAELPFFIDSPRILSVPSSVHCYHALLDLGRLLFRDSRQRGLRPVENQGYAVVDFPD